VKEVEEEACALWLAEGSRALARAEICAVAVHGVHNKEGNGLASGFEGNCWAFATSLGEWVSMMWVDLTFCITCNDCTRSAGKGSRGEMQTKQFYTRHFTNIIPE